MFDQIIILDIETTGYSSVKNEIIELGLVVVNSEGVKRWSRLIRCRALIPEHITKVTGISDQTYYEEPSVKIEDAVDYLIGLTESRKRTLIVGHDIRRFDLPFINEAFRKLKKKRFHIQNIYDTLLQAKADISNIKSRSFQATQTKAISYKVNRSVSLANIDTYYKFKALEPSHRAQIDALNTFQVLQKQIKKNRYMYMFPKDIQKYILQKV